MRKLVFRLRRRDRRRVLRKELRDHVRSGTKPWAHNVRPVAETINGLAGDTGAAALSLHSATIFEDKQSAIEVSGWLYSCLDEAPAVTTDEVRASITHVKLSKSVASNKIVGEMLKPFLASDINISRIASLRTELYRGTCVLPRGLKSLCRVFCTTILHERVIG